MYKFGPLGKHEAKNLFCCDLQAGAPGRIFLEEDLAETLRV